MIAAPPNAPSQITHGVESLAWIRRMLRSDTITDSVRRISASTSASSALILGSMVANKRLMSPRTLRVLLLPVAEMPNVGHSSTMTALV